LVALFHKIIVLTDRLGRGALDFFIESAKIIVSMFRQPTYEECDENEFGDFIYEYSSPLIV
jgi:hypothetical protein